jgi:hypothetical protein
MAGMVNSLSGFACILREASEHEDLIGALFKRDGGIGVDIQSYLCYRMCSLG